MENNEIMRPERGRVANSGILTSQQRNKIKIWLWVIGIVAISILSVILFCHVVYWLVWIGAITVVVLFIAFCVLVGRVVQKVKDATDD